MILRESILEYDSCLVRTEIFGPGVDLAESTCLDCPTFKCSLGDWVEDCQLCDTDLESSLGEWDEDWSWCDTALVSSQSDWVEDCPWDEKALEPSLGDCAT